MNAEDENGDIAPEATGKGAQAIGSSPSGWYVFAVEILGKRWIPVLLAGTVLATINQNYWNKRHEATLSEALLERRIDTYTSINEKLTRLLGRLNRMIVLNREQAARDRDDKADDEKVRTDVAKEIDDIANQLAIELSRAEVYFGLDVAIKAREFTNALAKESETIMGGETKEFVSPGSLLLSTVTNLSGTVSDALRTHLTRLYSERGNE